MPNRYKVRVLCTWVSRSDLSSYGCRIRRIAYGRAAVLVYLRSIAYLSNAWTLGTTTLSTLNHMRTLCEQCFYFFFWVDIILSQRHENVLSSIHYLVLCRVLASYRLSLIVIHCVCAISFIRPMKCRAIKCRAMKCHGTISCCNNEQTVKIDVHLRMLSQN